MSRYHCSCGFAIDHPGEFGDHYRMAFAPEDDIGIDGSVHAELANDYVRATRRHPDAVPLPRHVCACGYATGDTPDLDDHLLIVFITPDGIGSDGDKHVPLDPSTPDHWRIVRVPRD